ncbi:MULTISPECIES: type II CAAX prenyl endopeptidase Rce1 family protein [Emticicia]|uniref:CPBP family glutamic-type intramembrane protease n=1 Tax=Emticicia TaxID=312278 RepID=UPI0007D8AE1D|nr:MULTISPECIES: CPBP family glutamic-type intramembrane protease [Emticicia]
MSFVTFFQKLIFRLIQFLRFILNPTSLSQTLKLKENRLVDVGVYFGIIDFIISIILWFLTEITEKYGLFSPLNTKKDFYYSITETVIIGIFIAPIIEEFIFRYPLKFFATKKYFKWMLYIICLIFGLIHLDNYIIDNSHLLFAPLIVIIQIYGAFMFGFIRISYGFWYGVLLHMIHNSWSLIWKYTIGFDL